MKTSVNFKTGCGSPTCQRDAVYLELPALNPIMMEGLRTAALTCPDYGVLTVTSQADGNHKPNSLHYEGKAWDLRIRYMSAEDTLKWKNNLAAALDKDWDVVLEKDHIHIEYDLKRRG